MMTNEIIPPVPLELIKAELTPDRLLRVSNRAEREIYVVDGHSAPNIMREIGRLREIAFRDGGGGTGKECDIDEFDLMDPPCRQLIVWDPETEQILGGYRYIIGSDIRFRSDGNPRIATSHMFRFSKNSSATTSPTLSNSDDLSSDWNIRAQKPEAKPSTHSTTSGTDWVR